MINIWVTYEDRKTHYLSFSSEEECVKFITSTKYIQEWGFTID